VVGKGDRQVAGGRCGGLAKRSLPFSATPTRFPCLRLLTAAYCLLLVPAPNQRSQFAPTGLAALQDTEGSKELAASRKETEGANS
jgi:hypothetical protein